MLETQRMPSFLVSDVTTKWAWAVAGVIHAAYAVVVAELGRHLGMMPFHYGTASQVTIGLIAATITAIATWLWTHRGVRSPALVVVCYAGLIGAYIVGVRAFATHTSEWVLNQPVSFPHAYGISLLILIPLVVVAAIVELRGSIAQRLRAIVR